MSDPNDLLTKLARTHGMSIVEIAEFARATLSAELDPIRATGERFVFQRQRPRKWKFGDREEDFDLCWINTEVPDPHAVINLLDALEEFKSDVERCEMLLKGDLPIERLRAISKNQFAWCRFWAVRFPDGAIRATFARQAAEAEALMTENDNRVEEELARRGIERVH